MRHIVLIFSLIINSFASFTQNATVTGNIRNSETNETLPYANVTVHDPGDSSIVAGKSANADGTYVINLSYGTYLFKYSYIGFSTFWSKPQTIEKEKVSLPQIHLKSDSRMLQEAVIESEQNEMTMTLEKKVFNVTQDITSRGGSVSDVLENIPSVDVNQDGNVSLRGNSNVRILINGKQSGLVGISSAEALRMLNSEMVERVEIINNPSARYDAEGMAGIINIVLKKEKREGTNAIFSAGASYPWGTNASASLTHKTEKWTFSGNYSFRHNERPGYGIQKRIAAENGEAVRVLQDEDRTRQRTGHNMMLGAAWEPNKYNEIEFIAVGSVSRGTSDALIDYTTLAGGELRETSIRDFTEIENENSYNFTLEHTKTFTQKDRRWRTSIDFNDNYETEDADADQYFYDSAGNEFFERRLLQQTINKESQINGVLESDYEHPFSDNGKLEGGIKSSLRIINTEYGVNNYNTSEQVFEAQPQFTNDFLYDEGIHAAYFMYNNQWNKFSLMAGLRAEWSVIEIEQAQTNENISRSYVDPFPSFGVSYEVSKTNTFQINYSRRIRRPNFWNLNPFFNFRNPLNYRSGNPELNPQYTHSTELSHLFFKEKGSLNTSVYARESSGVIQYIQRIEDGITLTRPENVANQLNYGIEFAGNYRPKKGIRIGGSLNYYGSTLDATNIENGFKTTFSTWQAQINSSFELPQEIQLQVRVNHRASAITAQGVRNPITHVTTGIGKNFWDDQFSIDFNIRDLFNSRIRRARTVNSDFAIYDERQWRPRTYRLTLTYRIKNERKKDLEEKVKKELGGDHYSGDD